ncbi:cysteine--tRNA ligase [Facklamia sp. DSM 111018]|uniref:Cysteine--tRNA ligase n=1 Tax=Facklamia lactis TaxID=2749967 RepID=A0ABS0LT00_9LACT|nr:cysteine--tRNA ligase [Facklamia lactis]MBG9981332.1 cysteine--tRNA ligase [Facklamia lactis]MBG9987192.1 cysteine--tRNA ligase [Facklamia lactis]
MALSIFNTLTRQKEEFIPQQAGKVNFYVCGPTVYNYIHIGNARSAVAFDIIRRYLEYRGYEVNYVSNFTDVDDKIIKAAKEEKLTPKMLSDKYIAAYQEDTQAINVKPANIHPRVMDNIPEIIQYIKVLIEKGYAYESQGDVYFRTDKFETYGKLSDQSIADLRQGASQRLNDEENQRKESPLDFALWKATKDQNEISWESPWGFGRPGWHIECSVMSTKYLGEVLDIHGGGQDLQFPHHENEIAQSEAHSDHIFANYWMHNGFVTYGETDEKMSKSLGNFVLLRDLLEETDPMVVRYLLSTVHYRRPLRYDRNALINAEQSVSRLKEVLRRLSNRKAHLKEDSEFNDLSLHVIKEFEMQKMVFEEAMDDDFNAANGMTAIFEMVKIANRYLDSSEVERNILDRFYLEIVKLLDIFGLDLEDNEVLDAEVEAMIEERNQARKNKDFARADEIREQLKAQNILLDDTPQGTTWKRG